MPRKGLIINLAKEFNMKAIVLNEKNETALCLIAKVLQGYCETIYTIFEKESETTMTLLLGQMYSDILYDVLIAHEVEVCVKNDRYRDK